MSSCLMKAIIFDYNLHIAAGSPATRIHSVHRVHAMKSDLLQMIIKDIV